MLSRLLSGSARFRYLLAAAAAGIMIAGIARLPQMHADVLPETSPVVVEVQTEALGLSAPEVESLVTVPLEKNLLEGILNVTNITSDSIPGLSSIDLHFAPGPISTRPGSSCRSASPRPSCCRTSPSRRSCCSRYRPPAAS